MVKVSHARCRQCGQSRHRNVRENLCARCWKLRKPQLQERWREIKARRALKRSGGHAELEAVPSPLEETVEEDRADMSRTARVVLTPEQKVEIIDLYRNTDTPVKEIAETYGLGDTVPYRILVEAGITWRRGDEGAKPGPKPKRELPPHIAAMQEVHVAGTPTPEPAQITLSEPNPNGTVDLEEGTSRWSVVYITTSTLSVRANSPDEAMAKARAAIDPGIEIEMVRRERS